MAATKGQKAVVIINVIAFVLVIIVNYLSGAGSSNKFIQKLFNNRTISEVSGEYPVNITPAGYAFAIWGVIYLWQAIWLIYDVSTIFRTAAPIVLSNGYHISYILTCLLNIAWIFVWTHEIIVGSFVVLALNWVALVSTITFSYIDVQHNLATLKKLHPKDLTALQYLVQNGISIFTAWSTVATCINLCIMLVYAVKLTQTIACIIALSVLTAIALTYFVLENFVFASALRATFVPWFVIVWALSASVVKNYKAGQAEATFTVALLAAVSALILVRFCFIRPKVKPEFLVKNFDIEDQQLV